MTARIQTQRFPATGQRPANGARPSGELWLNLPDMRLGMINPAQAPVDLLPIRVYSSSAGYAAGDFVVNAGQLLQARAAIPAKPFLITDWNQYQSIAQSDARYLPLTGGTLTGSLFINATALQITAPAGQWASLQLSRQSGQGAQIVGYTGASPRWSVSPGNQTAETGGNAGSDFTISRCSDAGAVIDTPISIIRSTGVVNFVQPPTVKGGALPYVLLTGSNMSGALGVGGPGISFPGIGGFWGAHHVAFGWDGTYVEMAVDGGGVGVIATTSYVDANYLRLSGGTVGNLSVNAGITYAWTGNYAHAMSFGWDGGNILCWVDGTYEGALATQGFVSNYLPLAGGTLSGTLNVADGRVVSYNNGNNPSFCCWDTSRSFAAGMWSFNQELLFGGMDGSGNPASTYGLFNSAGSFYIRSTLGVGNFGGTPDISLLPANGGAASGLAFSTWTLAFNTGTGQLSWYNAGGTALFYCDPGGSLNAHQNVVAAANLFAMNGDAGLYAGGSGRVLQFAGNWYFDWNNSNGTLQWIANGQGFWMMRASDALCSNNIGYVNAVGYTTSSDVRTKTDIAAAACGLPEVLRLNPVSFRRDGKDRIELGFVAQDVAAVIPEAVHVLGIPLPDGTGALDSDTPTLGLSFNPIIAALVNAAKQLDQRLRSLEGNP
jgi:hypothetical protein